MNDDKLYTIREALGILHYKKANLYNRMKKHGISAVKVGKHSYLTDEQIEILRSVPRRKMQCSDKRLCRRKHAVKPGRKYYWRVSVWNAELCAYVVARCGLTKKEADVLIAGKDAVKRPCWRKK